jgi:hypothetical protein
MGPRGLSGASDDEGIVLGRPPDLNVKDPTFDTRFAGAGVGRNPEATRLHLTTFGRGC